MADYLLKGGKMLDKLCPVCGSPLFVVKGVTECVVCKERGTQIIPAPKEAEQIKTDSAPDISVKKDLEAPCFTSPGLIKELEETVIVLCRRCQNESRPEDCLSLMESIKTGVELLKTLK
ncbi:autoantigen p27 domain-containing protein [Methanochimaera problematica]|nr:autoantigen p27 domain-containing protein [Methanoplanus sp. FWC-SCC4]